jgi:hypothetical protein
MTSSNAASPALGRAGYSHARHSTGVNRAATFVDDENRMNELALLVEVVDSRDQSVHA